MEAEKKRRLAASGWVETTVEVFLDLPPEEVVYIDLKIHLGRELRRRRLAGDLTQTDLAGLMGSSQSRVAKMEAGDPSVSLDLLFRALLYLGVETGEMAQMIARFKPPGRAKPEQAANSADRDYRLRPQPARALREKPDS